MVHTLALWGRQWFLKVGGDTLAWGSGSADRNDSYLEETPIMVGVHVSLHPYISCISYQATLALLLNLKNIFNQKQINRLNHMQLENDLITLPYIIKSN